MWTGLGVVLVDRGSWRTCAYPTRDRWSSALVARRPGVWLGRRATGTVIGQEAQTLSIRRVPETPRRREAGCGLPQGVCGPLGNRPTPQLPDDSLTTGPLKSYVPSGV